MFTILETIGKHLFVPPFCAYCKVFLSTETIFCERCKGLIRPIVSVAMPITKRYSLKVYAISAYTHPLKKLILAKGWSDICSSAQLGELVWTMTTLKQAPIDYFVPIPLHWTRLARRGFNQAAEMARIISVHSNKPVADILKRVKRTQFQAELSAAERTKNIENAFVLTTKDVSMYRGKHLVLVDDLMTTGATLHKAAHELLKLKPASVSAVVACRVI